VKATAWIAGQEAEMVLEATSSQDSVTSRIHPLREPEAWIQNNERITNEADLEAWLSLYAPDVVFEAITDGASDRAEGFENVAASVMAVAALCKSRRLTIRKRFVAAQGNVIVNAWSGGFEGRDRQFGLEIWTLRDDKVVRHEQYTFMDVRPSESLTAKLRALFAGEFAIKLALYSARRANRRVRQGGLP
jgi:ketosteroid isomerase-like protein